MVKNPERPLYISKPLLSHLYSTMTQRAIAKLFEVDPGTIKRQLNIYNIPIDEKYSKLRQPKIFIEKDILQELYIEKSMSLREIHACLGHTPDLISKELKRHNIPLRSPGYPSGFIAGKDYGYKKLCTLYEKKLKKIRRFCNSKKNMMGFHVDTLVMLLRIIDEEI